MNELKKQTWAKVVAMLLAIISGFVLATGKSDAEAASGRVWKLSAAG